MDSIRPWSVTKLDVHHPGALVRTDPNERIHAGWILRLEQHAQRMRLRALQYVFSHIVNSKIPLSAAANAAVWQFPIRRVCRPRAPAISHE
jgi:hypothetical protein